MITIFHSRLVPVQWQESKVEISFIEGDVDVSEPMNRLPYAMVGSELFNVFNLKVYFEDLLDSQKEGIQGESDEVKFDYLKKKLKTKIPNGYWFKIQASTIVDGAESLVVPDYYGLKELPSIGFGTTEEEAHQDAIKRIRHRILWAYEKGRAQILGDVNHSDIPHHSSFEYIKGKELRKYLLIGESKELKRNTNDYQNSDSFIVNAIAEENVELLTLKNENADLRAKIAELESKLQNLKSSIQVVLNSF